MLIYGETFLEQNAKTLEDLKEIMGERSFNVAIEMGRMLDSEDVKEIFELPVKED